MEIPKIQLAIQGGGAKLVCLLAACKAIQDLQNNGQIRITRIAGTSAGSIAGGLLAAAIDLDEVKNDLQSMSLCQLEEKFPRPTLPKIVLKILRNKPLWKENNLREMLTKWFGRIRTFDDIVRATETDFFAIAANLTQSELVVYPYEPSNEIVNSIVDSCAIPFLFRTATSQGPVIVDGGIMENLPSEILRSRSTRDRGIDVDYGPIVCIAFERSVGKPPESSMQLAAAMIDSAIQNSMDRAARRVDRDFVFRITTPITTFDFDTAISIGFGDHFSGIERESRNYFRNLITLLNDKRAKIVSSETWPIIDEDIGTGISNLYEIHEHESPFEYLRTSIIVTANGLFSEDDQRKGPDIHKYVLKFRPLEKPVHCHRIKIRKSGNLTEFGGIFSIQVTSSRGELLKTKVVKMVSEEGERIWMVFFDPPLHRPDDGDHYILTIQNLMIDLLGELKSRGVDDLGLRTPRREGPSGSPVDIVLHYPREFESEHGEVKLSRHPSSMIDGRPMVESEIVSIDALSPPGFSWCGWTSDQCPPEPLGAFSVLLTT